MSLLLVCGAVFIGKEGHSSKIPPAIKPRGHFSFDFYAGKILVFIFAAGFDSFYLVFGFDNNSSTSNSRACTSV